MKLIYLMISILTILLLLLRCNCTDCPDKLSNYYFPYDNRDTVHFINENKGEIIDTVKLGFILPLDEKYCSGTGRESTMDCSGQLRYSIGGYYVYVRQGANYENNYILLENVFSYDDKHTCFDCFKVNDTLDFIYRNIKNKAFVYIISDTSITKRDNYYSKYIISEDNKLLQYTQVIDKISYDWNLK